MRIQIFYRSKFLCIKIVGRGKYSVPTSFLLLMGSVDAELLISGVGKLYAEPSLLPVRCLSPCFPSGLAMLLTGPSWPNSYTCPSNPRRKQAEGRFAVLTNISSVLLLMNMR